MHAQRGQAIVETVVFLPMFLLALSGTIWAVQTAVQYERVESAVRYAGLISQRANPYMDYSLYAMYMQLGKTAVPGVTCVTPLSDPLSDAAPTYSSATTPTASAPFWTPANNPQPTCATGSLVGIPAGTALAQDVILSQQQPGMISSVTVPPFLQPALGARLTTPEADEHFFRPIGVNLILGCYASLNKQVTSSLEYTTDTSADVTPVALNSTVTALTPAPDPSCTNL
jgi:hypothetical protein